jgi:hypothetical protein
MTRTFLRLITFVPGVILAMLAISNILNPISSIAAFVGLGWWVFGMPKRQSITWHDVDFTRGIKR